MKNIREAIRNIISERILPWIEHDGISGLILPEQIAISDCAEPIEGKHLCEIRHYEYIFGFGLTGKTPYCISNRIFTFTPGKIVLMPRWTPHGTIRNVVHQTENFDINQTSLTLWMMPRPFGVHVQILHDVGNADKIKASQSSLLLGRYFDRLTIRLLEEVESKPPNYDRVGRAILTEFMERCLRATLTVMSTRSALSQRQPTKRKPATISRSLSRGKTTGTEYIMRRIQAAREFIHSNYHTPIGLDDIAHAVNTSTDHLGRQFKTVTGLTTMQYLLDVRMETAKSLLLTNMRIHDVAHMVGIKDHCYFSRLFHRTNGVSPQQYRQQMPQVAGPALSMRKNNKKTE